MSNQPLQFKHLDADELCTQAIVSLRRQLSIEQELVNDFATRAGLATHENEDLRRKNAELLSLVEALTAENRMLRGIGDLVE